MENDTSLCLMENDKSYNLAVKVMYNFDYESNSDAIIRGMKKELLPLQRVNCQTEKSSWNPFFRSVPYVFICFMKQTTLHVHITSEKIPLIKSHLPHRKEISESFL